MSKETGGPAFPGVVQNQMNGHVVDEMAGMTLRDYFAGQALIACRNHSNEKWLAQRAYKIADSMLEARTA